MKGCIKVAILGVLTSGNVATKDYANCEIKERSEESCLITRGMINNYGSRRLVE